MIVITGRMRVPPEHKEKFLVISKRQVELSRAEPGCLSYWLHEDVWDRGTFFYYEEWKDRSAVDFHFKQAYCLEFVKALRGLTEGRPQMNIRTIADKAADPA